MISLHLRSDLFSAIKLIHWTVFSDFMTEAEQLDQSLGQEELERGGGHVGI